MYLFNENIIKFVFKKLWIIKNYSYKCQTNDKLLRIICKKNVKKFISFNKWDLMKYNTANWVLPKNNGA